MAKRIVFMGTPSFSVPILQALADQYQILGVVTQPDRPVGRKRQLAASPVKQAAEKLGLPVLQPEKLTQSSAMNQIIAWQPDFIITAAYGQFLPEKLLQAARIGAINVHGSLLPKYRGGAPVQYALLSGDAETGITIMYMVKAMDAGEMLAQASIPITQNDDTGTLFQKLSQVGCDLLLATLPKVINQTITPVAQDESQVVLAPTLKREDEQLDLTQPAMVVDRKIRALRPHPGAYLLVKGQRLKIWQAVPLQEKTTATPGTIVSRSKHALCVAAGQGTILSLKTVQPAGKPQQDISAYLNGHQELVSGGELLDK
ncbi:methionyl-tRNA formyltransferase [Fructilactobacillus florum]|uniref:methionyl-tRNA formyltransferase n=1 Tax=Fructilactobacillus florum TaxID=640331 RepID=UPI00028D3E53|nr:methionyl-tRNA formyltransferase [Fructilactobacillus florum]EKK20728.1 Methionyl-tRNA formyltransferase [Fructilactobacillus florum 2F]